MKKIFRSTKTSSPKIGNSVCYIADMPHHYREPIFRLMNQRFGCQFYFGDKPSTIKKIATSELPGFQATLKYISIPLGLHYIAGSVLKSLKYEKIILLGDPHGIQNWIICLLGRLTGKQVYLWTHGWYGRESILRGFLKKALFRLSSKILVYGNRAKMLLMEQGFAGEKLRVVYNSLNYERQLEACTRNTDYDFCKRYFANSYPVIVYVGRVQKIKRLDLVLEAMHKLKSERFLINFVVVGGEGDSSIKELVNKYNLKDQVWFYGPCYEESELCRVLSSSDICVSPGNVGLTAIHALAYGCPVITHDDHTMQMPEVESITPGMTGDFFAHGNVDDLAAKIKLWVEKQKNEKPLIKEQCYREIRNSWNPSTQVELIIDALDVTNFDNNKH